jgi:hypothetical protein
MQLCFVSVHGPRETYFVDEPRINRPAQLKLSNMAAGLQHDLRKKKLNYSIPAVIL